MLRPLHAILDDLVHAEIELRHVRADREAAVALLTDADGRLDRAKARASGLREELEAQIRHRVTHAAVPA
jgi:hypothetical protein